MPVYRKPPDFKKPQGIRLNAHATRGLRSFLWFGHLAVPLLRNVSDVPRYFFKTSLGAKRYITMERQSDFLHIPYKQLPISGGLKRFFSVHSIPNMEKLLEIQTKELLEMKWFNARLFYELTSLLEEKGELERLK